MVTHVIVQETLNQVDATTLHHVAIWCHRSKMGNITVYSSERGDETGFHLFPPLALSSIMWWCCGKKVHEAVNDLAVSF